MNQISILVVDDEPRNFDVIEALLSEQRYDLQYASSGQEALESLAIMPIDLILLDVMMPEMDGIELCTRIKSNSQWKSIPIIMVTALTEKEDLARCIKAGADDFLSKPVNSLELRARVHSMLRIKKQYDQIQSFSTLQKDTINMLKRNLQQLSGNIASSLPHEINTPLNGILGILEILIQDHKNMKPKEVNEFLLLSYQSAVRLNNLTERFITYVQLELNTSMGNFKPLNELDFLKIPSHKSMIEMAEIKATERRRSNDLSCKLDSSIKPQIRLEDLQKIINELLDNAFKFSASGTVVNIKSEDIDNTFNLFITDQGRGMTHEQIANVGAFRQFERQLYEQQGVGLGLKIVSKIVEMYGGKLKISSVYKQKTTIHIQLPLA